MDTFLSRRAGGVNTMSVSRKLARQLLAQPQGESKLTATLCLAAVANCVLELFVYQHNPTVQQIWQTMSQQLAGCTDCINNYHTAQVGLEQCTGAFRGCWYGQQQY